MDDFMKEIYLSVAIDIIEDHLDRIIKYATREQIPNGMTMPEEVGTMRAYLDFIKSDANIIKKEFDFIKENVGGNE